MQNYYGKINNLRKELTAGIVEYLKGLPLNFIIIPDEDEFEDATYVMWVDDDGYANDGRVKEIRLDGDDGFSIDVENDHKNQATLYSSFDIGCRHVEWLASMLSMLETLIDGDNWRYCHECGKVMSEGFLVNGGDAYYCSKECLHKHHTPKEWAEMCAGPEGYEENGNDENYWTDWAEC